MRTYAGEIANTHACAPISSTRARLRTHMRAQAMPGEDPETLKPPEVIVPDIIRMLSPDYAENNVLFEFATGVTTKFG